MITVIILIYFVLVLSFSFFKARFLDNAFFELFKSLFPSWKFFDESIDTPVLLYRFVSQKGPANEWQIAVPVPPRRWYNVLWNPEGNFYLAYHSHMQQLMNDLMTLEDEKMSSFHHHLSYQLTANFLKARHFNRPYQFKVSTIKKTEAGFEVLEDILLSQEMNS